MPDDEWTVSKRLANGGDQPLLVLSDRGVAESIADDLRGRGHDVVVLPRSA